MSDLTATVTYLSKSLRPEASAGGGTVCKSQKLSENSSILSLPAHPPLRPLQVPLQSPHEKGVTRPTPISELLSAGSDTEDNDDGDDSPAMREGEYEMKIIICM